MTPLPAASHLAAEALGAAEAAGQVDVEHGLEDLERLRLGGAHLDEAGAVDEHVDATEARECLARERVDVRGARHVATERQRLGAVRGEARGELLQPVGAPRREHDASARRRETLGERRADPR